MNRVTESEKDAIFHRAAKLYAAHNSTTSYQELISIGEGAHIPERFIKQAHNEIIQNRRYRSGSKQRSHNKLISLTFCCATIITGVFGYGLAKTSSSPQQQVKIVTKKPEPKPPFPDNLFYVHDINHEEYDGEKKYHDGNPMTIATVYQNGADSGHVTKLNCLFPPDRKFKNIKAFVYTNKVVEIYGDYFRFCTPFDLKK